ncbi:MAG: ATP-binding protein [Armatimonadota bacterium]
MKRILIACETDEAYAQLADSLPPDCTLEEPDAAVRAVSEWERLFWDFVRAYPEPAVIYDAEGNLIDLNPAWSTLTKQPREMLQTVIASGYNVLQDEELVEKNLMAPFIRAFAGEVAVTPEFLYEYRYPNTIAGRPIGVSPQWISVVIMPVKDIDGHLKNVVVFYLVSTERVLARDREAEFYRHTLEAATEGKLIITTRDEILKLAGPPVVSVAIADPTDLARARDAAGDLSRTTGVGRVSEFVLCVGEAATNALRHAAGGEVTFHRVADGIMAIISDNGPGIEALNLPRVALVRGYTTAASLGMGYKLMIALADKVYLCTGSGGTTVGIEMHR